MCQPMETTDPSGQNLENTGKESPHYFYDIFFGKIQRFFGLFCASSAIIESYGGTSMPKWAWYICKSEQHHFFKLWGGTVHNWKKMSICSKVCFLENPTNPRLRWPLPGRFVPAQRWLHNIEHGAIVMLYHPCTHHTLVEKLRALVKGCIRYIVESICISTLCTILSGNTSSLLRH